MLSVSARRWPDGGRWVMQPKWDGFRLLVEINRDGRTRAWSRHGTDLTARLGLLLAAFTDVAPATTFDGELVAVSERDGKPTQDFAAVTRGVFTAKPAAMDRLLRPSESRWSWRCRSDPGGRRDPQRSNACATASEGTAPGCDSIKPWSSSCSRRDASSSRIRR